MTLYSIPVVSASEVAQSLGKTKCLFSKSEQS